MWCLPFTNEHFSWHWNIFFSECISKFWREKNTPLTLKSGLPRINSACDLHYLAQRN